MQNFSKIEEQIKRYELELADRRQQLGDLVLDFTPKEKEQIIKKGGNDFFYFAKKVFPEYCTYPFSRMHKDIHKFYLKVIRDLDLVEGPPEHGKTALLRIMKIWGAIYGKRFYQIKIAETMALSTIDLASIKIEFEDNPRIKFLYGDLRTTGKWDEGAFKVAPTKFNKYGCWFEAFAFGVPPTGRLREHHRPDFCDIDDIENYRKSGNIKISQEKLNFINNDVLPRLSMTSACIWFGNNARKTMAINIITEMEPRIRERDYPAFKIHIYPAFDVIKKEALWKEVYKFNDEEEMRKHFKVGILTWKGNYMQSPVVPDGTEFKLEHWREYKEMPADAIGIVWCDPASGKSGCYKAAAPIFFSKTTLKFYIPECFCSQCDWEKYFLWMYDIYKRYQKRIRFIGWEKDFHQDQFILFKKLYPSMEGKPDLPIRPMDVKGQGPKDERIRSLTTPYEYGKLLFHEDFLLSKEGVEAQLHLIGFPDYSFKDFADALASGYRIVFNMFAGFMNGNENSGAGYESIDKLRTSRGVH